MKKLFFLIMILIAAVISGCQSDADLASSNLSKDANMFRINRRIVFYNGTTDKYILSIQGLCSLGNYDKSRKLWVICKTGPSEFKKYFLGLSDNVTFFAEQLDAAPANTYRYKMIFKPAAIIPDIELSN